MVGDGQKSLQFEEKLSVVAAEIRITSRQAKADMLDPNSM